MITSFFKTSKPIHYIIFSIVLMSLFFHQRIFVSDFESTLSNYLKEGACLLVVIASFFALIFIVTKNNLTQNNSFAALFFCLFVGVFPQILDYTPTLTCFCHSYIFVMIFKYTNYDYTKNRRCRSSFQLLR